MAFAWRHGANKGTQKLDENYTTDIDDIYYGKKKSEATAENGEYDYSYEDGVGEVGIETAELPVEEVAKAEPLRKRTFTPISCKECRKIVDAYKDGKVIIIGREELDYDNFIRLFDYVMGAVQALDGEFKKLDNDTVALLPYGCDKDIVIEELEEAPVAEDEAAAAETEAV